MDQALRRVGLDVLRFLFFFLRPTWGRCVCLVGKPASGFTPAGTTPQQWPGTGGGRGGACGRGRGVCPCRRAPERPLGALQSRDVGEPPRRSPYRRLASLPRKRKCGLLFCCFGNKGPGAADLRGPSPLNKGEFQAPRVLGDWGSLRQGRSEPPKVRGDAEEGRGDSRWLVITDSRPQTSEQEGGARRGRSDPPLYR